MALPTDTNGGLGGGDYFKPAIGQNKIMIVGDAVIGYEYWTAEDKPVRSKTKFNEPLDNPKVRQVKNQKTGEMENKTDGQKFFWAMPVYDFKDETFKLWQVTQKGLRDNLASLQTNADWGNPVGNYTINIDRKGEGLLTEYTVMANPVKDKKVLDAIMAKYAQSPMNVDEMMF
jgi:hypothetical protein